MRDCMIVGQMSDNAALVALESLDVRNAAFNFD